MFGLQNKPLNPNNGYNRGEFLQACAHDWHANVCAMPGEKDCSAQTFSVSGSMEEPFHSLIIHCGQTCSTFDRQNKTNPRRYAKQTFSHFQLRISEAVSSPIKIKRSLRKIFQVLRPERLALNAVISLQWQFSSQGAPGCVYECVGCVCVYVCGRRQKRWGWGGRGI